MSETSVGSELPSWDVLARCDLSSDSETGGGGGWRRGWNGRGDYDDYYSGEQRKE